VVGGDLVRGEDDALEILADLIQGMLDERLGDETRRRGFGERLANFRDAGFARLREGLRELGALRRSQTQEDVAGGKLRRSVRILDRARSARARSAPRLRRATLVPVPVLPSVGRLARGDLTQGSLASLGCGRRVDAKLR